MDETQSHSESTNSVPPAQTTTTPKSKGNSFAIPAAILFGFGMIAFAIYAGGNKAPVVVQNIDGSNDDVAAELVPVPEVNETDHILGNPNAPIVVVEYSDYDCPFCKAFHETMQKVMDAYGADGKVAWVYRHFPIDRLHPSAPYIASAGECVAELGGNEAFWKFSDLVFGERETNAMTDTARLPEFAVTAGVDVADFNECVESGRTEPLVEEDIVDAVNAGVNGTPFSFIMIAGQQLPVNGAQPYEFMSANIESLLTQLERAEEEGNTAE